MIHAYWLIPAVVIPLAANFDLQRQMRKNYKLLQLHLITKRYTYERINHSLEIISAIARQCDDPARRTTILANVANIRRGINFDPVEESKPLVQ